MLAKIEADEKEKTGIRNLRVGYNRVFGYYIEVAKGQVDLVPDTYIRKQTLSTGERYITAGAEGIGKYDFNRKRPAWPRWNTTCSASCGTSSPSQAQRVQQTAQAVAAVDVLLLAGLRRRDIITTASPEIDLSGEVADHGRAATRSWSRC